MPELPEVETIKRDLAKKIVGQKITQVCVYDCRVIRNCSARAFIKNLTGQTIQTVSRRGKALIFTFRDTGHLIVQPMMTGQLIYTKSLSFPNVFVGGDINPKNSCTKITFQLSKHNYLNYNDQRLFGRLQFCRTLKEIKFFKDLGPEPLSSTLSARWLADQLTLRSTPIKNLLMNQEFVAGIGNIYASEILFAAGIHPRRAAKTLSKKETHFLHGKIKEVLTQAIRFRGTSMRDYRDAGGHKGNYINRIKVYGREGQGCLSCRTPVERFVQAGRSTFFCRRCQK